ncbi:hypothetical protein SAMN04488124_0358 [Halogeometricum limi]|uniref:Uncharacterized protein n=2 Tax=Halogeometricum limi TaxID=555875 RepID=A0A1I6FV31_9EURY|nr:hypothetical protein SAMN04488124_0358 [Halogeometricum limi]
MSFDRYGALATLARTRGHTASEERTLAHVRDELAETAAPAPEDLTTARRRAAEAGAETERLRERAATIRGRLEATRDAGADAEAVERELEETMRRLSEVATERVAARQRLDVQETQARAARDSRERRMRLEDRIANLRRTIRRSLAETVYEEFGGAVTALPDAFDADAGDEPGGYDGEPVAAALAFARVAPLRAPVVVEATVAERFENAATLARYLRGPLVVC